MNKVYTFTYKKNSSDLATRKVLARNAGDAYDKAMRWIKKNEYWEKEIICVEFYCEIDVVYKS